MKVFYSIIVSIPLLILNGCSTLHCFYLVNFEALNLNIPQTSVITKYMNGQEHQAPLKIIDGKNNKKRVAVGFANANVPKVIILKDNTTAYTISFEKKVDDGCIYKFQNRLYLIRKDTSIFDFKNPMPAVQ